ncbi:MAG: hypothetical protein ACO3IP_10415 [Burkholderiaceae bacterium]
MPVAYTDLFNEALDDLSTFLATVTGLQVVTDPRNLVPPCAMIGAPTFTAFNNNIVNMEYPIQIVTLGPGNLDAMRSLLHTASQVLGKNVAITAGRPTSLDVGGVIVPAYELTANMQAQTA